MDIKDIAVDKGSEYIEGLLIGATLPAPEVRIKTAAILSDGAAGVRIAHVMAKAGISVTVIETDAGAVERAEHFHKRLASDANSAPVRFVTRCDSGLKADIIIDRLPDAYSGRAEALASVNHSGAVVLCTAVFQDFGGLRQSVPDPDRMLLANFVEGGPQGLLELGVPDNVDPLALAVARAFAGQIGYAALETAPLPGLIAARLQMTLYSAIDALLLEGSTPWELDEAMVEFGFATGPLEAQDHIGLDRFYARRRALEAAGFPQDSLIADRMLQEGRLGKHAGVGWYRYPGGGGAVIDPLMEDMTREEAYFAKIRRREIDAPEVRHRLVEALIAEAHAIVREGIATTGNVDLISVLGVGFPAEKGGVLCFREMLEGF